MDIGGYDLTIRRLAALYNITDLNGYWSHVRVSGKKQRNCQGI